MKPGRKMYVPAVVILWSRRYQGVKSRPEGPKPKIQIRTQNPWAEHQKLPCSRCQREPE